MKHLQKFTLVLLAAIACTGILSCSDDNDGGSSSLNGKWYVSGLPTSYHDYTGKAYHFMSKNTLRYYNYIANYRHWDNLSEELPQVGSGYYIQKGVYETYTYYVNDNKIYIPQQGRILTISGNKLYLDGSSMTFTRR